MEQKNYTFDDLTEIMERLLSDKGCPWDREQTHETLREFTLEEAYEVAEAIDSHNYDALKGELGDLLLQVVFHSALAEKLGKFRLGDVTNSICRKMLRRHPHVFSEEGDVTTEEVLRNWEEIKKNEKKDAARDRSMLDGLPKAFPALQTAQAIQERVSRVGFDWHNSDGVYEKIKEEIAELEAALKTNDASEIEDEIGDILFSIVNLARFLNLSAETCLRKTIDKFKKRFHYIEQKTQEKNLQLQDMTIEQMDAIWEEAKKQQQTAG